MMRVRLIVAAVAGMLAMSAMSAASALAEECRHVIAGEWSRWGQRNAVGVCGGAKVDKGGFVKVQGGGIISEAGVECSKVITDEVSGWTNNTCTAGHAKGTSQYVKLTLKKCLEGEEEVSEEAADRRFVGLTTVGSALAVLWPSIA